MSAMCSKNEMKRNEQITLSEIVFFCGRLCAHMYASKNDVRNMAG